MEDVLAYDKAKSEPIGLRLPGEVVSKVIKQHKSILQAWWEHLDLTQAEMAKRIGVRQSEIARLETKGRRLRISTRKKAAAALGIDMRLLEE